MNPGTDNLVSYWSMEESSGTRVDSHGSNDLTDNNTVGSGTGIQGTAADMEQSNSEYFSRNDQTWGFTNFTFQIWLKSENLGASCSIYDMGSGPGDRDNQIALGYNNPLNVFTTYVTDSSGSIIYNVRSSISTFTTGVWYHLCVVWDGSTITFYIDGVDRTQIDSAGSGTRTDSLRPLFLGTNDNIATSWDGLMDEVAIWSTALSSDEVSWLYNSGSGRSYADLSGTGGDATGGSGNFLLMGAG